MYPTLNQHPVDDSLGSKDPLLSIKYTAERDTHAARNSDSFQFGQYISSMLSRLCLLNSVSMGLFARECWWVSLAVQ